MSCETLQAEAASNLARTRAAAVSFAIVDIKVLIRLQLLK